MPEPLVVQREVQIAAPRAAVFAFLTDPEKILSWIGAEATTEAYPGGLYLVTGSSLIEIDLVERDGGTLLRMTHSGLPDATQVAYHDRGWAHYLGRLAIAAAGRDPGIDRGPPPRQS